MEPTKHEDVFLEIGNSVFMQYKKTESGWEELPQKNVDFGGGLERIAMVVQGKTDIFETDNFWPMVEKIQILSGKEYKRDVQTTRAMRILADHIRGATFMAMDGVEPSNKDQGYVLRRLLRRMVRTGMSLGVEKDISVNLVGVVIETFKWLYPELADKKERIEKVFENEKVKFRKTLNAGAKEVAGIVKIYKDVMVTGSDSLEPNRVSGDAFDLYQSYGYPVEMFLEDLKDNGFKVDNEKVLRSYRNKVEEHQKLSRSGAEQKFKGGLADKDETTIKYHTVNHLLQAALRKVLGDHVIQRGSNITSERIRFDFSYDSKLNDEQIAETEKLINEKIRQKLPVNYVDSPKEEAEKSGAIHVFGEKYGDVVRVYFIGDTIESAFSREFCGGPHVKNTGELAPVQIYKQESIGKGIMRVYVRF